MVSKRSAPRNAVTAAKRALYVGVSLAAAAIATPAMADFDDAMRAYSIHPNGQIDQAKIREAIDLWSDYAKAGDVLSRQVLGDIYSNQPLFNCDGSRPNPNAPMPSETGAVEPNNVEALAWYILASSHNFESYNQEPDFRMINCKARAQTRVYELMSSMPDEHVYMAQDRVVSLLSSESEFDIYRLGLLFQRGEGLPKNNIEALKYFTIASTRMRNSNPYAIEAAGPLKSIMTREEILEAEERARHWSPPLGDFFPDDNPVASEIQNQVRQLDERRLALAIADIEREFDERNEHLIQGALAALGLYRGPIDGDRGPMTRAAIERFQYNLVEDRDDMSETQKRDSMTGVLTPPQKVALIREAARVNHPQSLYIYGVMYAEGIGVPVNGKEAIFWLERAASYGYPLGHFALGKYYREGIYGPDPVSPSRAKAAQHFGQAAGLGYTPAEKELEELYEFGYQQ